MLSRRFFYAMHFFVCSSQVLAATPLKLGHLDIHKLQAGFSIAASKATHNLRPVYQHTDSKDMTHLRLQQYYRGFPVYGGYAVFHGREDRIKEHPSFINGQLYQGLAQELGMPSSDFVAAGDKIFQELSAEYPNTQISEKHVEPIVYVDTQNVAHWAYKISFLVTFVDKAPQRPSAIIDASTKKPLLRWEGLKTAYSLVQGVGYGGNHYTGAYQFAKEFPSLLLNRNNSSGLCSMQNNEVTVADMHHRYSGPYASMRFACTQTTPFGDHSYWTGYSGDGYDAINGAYSPSNDALFAGGVVTELYRQWYGLSVLTERGHMKPLVMRVHYGHDYENAYWDGSNMTFGDGGDEFYPLVSIGITAHEVSHGFTEQHADLEYVGQSGGINESFSDMAAITAEYYATGTTQWLIGAEILKNNDGNQALRYLKQPSLDGRSIDKADEYGKDLDVHHSSGVFNRLFYLLATRPTWSIRQAFHVMIKANMDYWTPTSNFTDAACGILNAAKDLGYSVEDVRAVLQEVAIPLSDCSREYL